MQWNNCNFFKIIIKIISLRTDFPYPVPYRSTIFCIDPALHWHMARIQHDKGNFSSFLACEFSKMVHPSQYFYWVPRTKVSTTCVCMPKWQIDFSFNWSYKNIIFMLQHVKVIYYLNITYREIFTSNLGYTSVPSMRLPMWSIIMKTGSHTTWLLSSFKKSVMFNAIPKQSSPE